MDQALEHALCHYQIGFVPQVAQGDGDGGMLRLLLPPDLPKRPQSGFGVALTELIGSNVVGSAFANLSQSIETQAVKDAMSAASLLSPGNSPDTIKTQIMGPVSLLQTVRDGQSRSLWSAPQLHQVVLDWCTHIALAVGRILQEKVPHIVFWLDEPMLGLMVDPKEKQQAYALLRECVACLKLEGFSTGIHCCSSPPIALMDDPHLDYFSCDALRYPQEIHASSQALSQFTSAGGTLALGVIAPLSLQADPHPHEMIARLGSDLGWKNAEEMCQSLVLTPSCGTMLTPLAREIAIARTLQTWSQDLVLDWKRE